ncbi:MAG TPA: hypothetical protein VI299_09445, partial [Polyangiales bacterium]
MKRMWLGAGALGLVGAISACGSDGTMTSDGVQDARGVGDLSLGLTLPNGVTVTEVQFRITRHGVAVRTGSIPVAADGTVTTTVANLDAGSGYHVELTSNDTQGSCVGAADFEVVTGTTTLVSVVLFCDQETANGNARVNGTFNVCPRLRATSVTPTTVAVGESAQLSIVASDADGDPIAYGWTAVDGTYSAPNATNTRYTCASAGSKTLTVSFQDNHDCKREATVSLSCVGGGLDGGSDAGGNADAGVANIQILAFNDFHGNIEPPTGSNGNVVPGRAADGGLLPSVTAGGAAYFARHIADLRASNPNTVVVSAGDLIGASPLASALFHDEPTIEAMNMIGLDINAVGNHEFDDGRSELLRMQNGGCAAEGCSDGGTPFAGADFQFLAANVKTESGETLFPRYTIKELDGVKVAFIGMTLEGTPGIVTPTGVAGLTFYDEADTVNMLVPALQAQGIKAIVVVVHEGGFQS